MVQCDSEPARTNTVEITVAVVHRHSVRTSWPQPLQCDSQPVTTIALQITMAVTHRTAGGPAATTRAAAPSGGSGYCACHCRERGGPSGDNARRSPFWRLWVLRLPQRRQCAPQPLLEALGTAPATAESEGGPAATTRAAAPSAGSMEIAMAVVHRHSVRTSWPQPLQCDSQPVTTIALQITMAVTHRTAGGPAATTRAAAPSRGSGYCACHCRERGGPSGGNARRSPFWRLWVLRLPPATTRAAAPSGGSGYCACHCRERGGPSGDNARRSPFWRLWVLRLPLQRARGAQRRQRAPQPLLEALVLRLPLQRERGAQRRQRAPQPLLQSLDDRLCECE